jgi:F-type H+-transporting ATPase subunit b
MFLSLDGTLIVQVINFIIFVAILWAVFLRPVGAAIARRRAYIDGLITDCDAAIEARRAILARAEAERASALRDADEIVGRARAEASAVADGITAEYAAHVAAKVEAAQAVVALELERAREHEGRLVSELADTLTQRALGGVA